MKDILHEEYKGISVETTQENKDAGAYIIIDKVLDIFNKFDDVQVTDIYAFESQEGYEEGTIEFFFIDNGSTEEEYGDSTYKIADLIYNELHLHNYLGEENYGELDLIILSDYPYDKVEKLKKL